MRRYDLRHLKSEYEPRMSEILKAEHPAGEVAIFLFEIGDFSPIQRSADIVKECGYDLLNSLKFNEVDWTIVAKKEVG
ncbi:MAG: NADH-ubiquinone oxidoreductase subunit E family protein [Sulfuricurvum sp.]